MDGEFVDTGGPEDRLLPWGRVRDIAGISRSTAWRMQQSGDFPTPVVVSPGRVGWWESELTAWKGARGTAKALKPPLRPRLGGMPRRTPIRPAAGASDGTGVQAGVSDQPMKELTRRPEGKRRARPVHVDQIDFGF
ncbi:helix-turn-helix transcriptional regulator [Brevundimonas sp. M-11_2]|uniref:helix-turn-helix transcriptional regulator n=1 Tax=Brevundimonas sp. M-11_2 TaxID=3233039 RepID=UPI003F8FD5E5